MMQGSWRVIHESDAPEVILAVDFPITGRPEAGFPDLRALLGEEFTFLQTAPPQASPMDRVSGADYVQPWISELGRLGRPVSAVMGYCVGGVYSAPVVEAVTVLQGRRPKVILFDPEYADVLGLSLELQRVLGELGALLSEEEIVYARKAAEELSTTATDVGDFAVGIAEMYREAGAAAFRRVGLGDDYQHEVIRLFESFMSWMSVADRIDPSAVWRDAVAVSSNDEMTLLNRDGVDLVGRQISFDVVHADLLRSAPVAEAVLEYLRS